MKDFKQYYILPATPEEVYHALTNPMAIKIWTDQEAIMSTEENSFFSIMDGSISGKNIAFIPDQKIVQEWDFGDQDEASVVTIKLHPKGTQTSVEVRQTNIPDDAYEDITEGWTEVYMANLIEFFSE
jgi:activator of HSP90 ATPase